MPITSRLMLINRARIIEFSSRGNCYLHPVLGRGQGKARSSVMGQILTQARCVRRLMSIRSCEAQNRMNFL